MKRKLTEAEKKDILSNVPYLEETVDIILRNETKVLGCARQIPGVRLCPLFEIKMETVGKLKVPFMPEAKAIELCELASLDVDAYDLANWIAGTQGLMALKNGFQWPSHTLAFFGCATLTGELQRPKKGKGPTKSQDIFTVISQYRMCVYLHEVLGIAVSKNTANIESKLCACDLVAEAHTRAGNFTTTGKIRSIYYDSAYLEIRNLSAYLDEVYSE